jgi:hypothetical protein
MRGRMREPHRPEVVNITVPRDDSMQEVPQTFASKGLHSPQVLLREEFGGAGRDRTAE